MNLSVKYRIENMISITKLHGIRCSVYSVVCCFLFACSSTDEIDKSYMQSPSVKPITMPEGLAAPANKVTLLIPQEDVADNGLAPEKLQIPPSLEQVIKVESGEEGKEASEQNEEGQESKPKLTSRVVMQPDGDESLLVDANSDIVWPLVSDAFRYYGYTIEDANQGRLIYTVARVYEKQKTRDDPRQFEYDTSVPKEKYLVYLMAKEEKTDISMRNSEGQIDGSALARQLLIQLKNYLSNPRPVPEAAKAVKAVNNK